MRLLQLPQTGSAGNSSCLRVHVQRLWHKARNTDPSGVLQAPVSFSLVQQGPAKAGAEGIRVRARNKQLFASTAGLLFTWRLLLDGAALPIGDMLQQTPHGWHPGGQIAIEPQVS